MPFQKINIYQRSLKVLVAPLDWGLGHATRCIPIIYSCIAAGFEVIIAADGPTKILLKSEFPDVDFTVLKGYEMQYSSHVRGFKLSLVGQIPKVLGRIGYERKWLKKIVSEKKIDLVISDNRFGLHHSSIPCIYITHQLQIQTGNRFITWLAQKIHYHYINGFSECWVPDLAQQPWLSGVLAHPVSPPLIPVRYIGPVSRLEWIDAAIQYDLLVLISGPEPQRSIFEQLVLQQIDAVKGNVLLVRGLPGETEPIATPNHVTAVSHLNAQTLGKAMLQSRMIVCRSGYTTIMDLVKLKLKAILVPTPGQTEQEYLADYLLQQQLFYSTSQRNFSLASALDEAASFHWKTFPAEPISNSISIALHEFVNTHCFNTPGNGNRG